MWALKAINSTIEVFSTGMTLYRSRTDNLHISQYHTTEHYVSYPIFVIITITCTVQKTRVESSQKKKNKHNSKKYDYPSGRVKTKGFPKYK